MTGRLEICFLSPRSNCAQKKNHVVGPLPPTPTSRIFVTFCLNETPDSLNFVLIPTFLFFLFQLGVDEVR